MITLTELLASDERLREHFKAHEATFVRKKLVTDGPFAETKEAVGGFDLLECGSLEEAVEIAATHPMAEAGTIEVRPLWGIDGCEFRRAWNRVSRAYDPTEEERHGRSGPRRKRRLRRHLPVHRVR
jgi:hypothetical protein